MGSTDTSQKDEQIPSEEWRPVVGYEGFYEVSSLGRIRRVKIITPVLKKHGYLQVSLTDKSGGRKSLRLHRLVAEAFIPNPLDKPQVNHMDENTLNNRADNLEWATPKENTNYGSRTERATANNGSRTPVLQIEPQTLVVVAEYDSQSAAARATGISLPSINACLHGKQKRAGGFIWKYKYKKIVL